MRSARLTAGILAVVTTTLALSPGKQTYSLWMADSLISRNDGIMNESSASLPLQAGFTQKAFTALLSQYSNQSIKRDYLSASVNSVLPYFSNATEDVLLYPLDRLSNGNAEISLSSHGKHGNGTEALHAGFEALRLSIDAQPRNSYGGLWYYTYPDWSYLDGMYSLAPFYSLYTLSGPDGTNDSTALNTTALDDMAYQLDLLWQHCRNSSSGLLVHGYDASLTAVWADPVTGASPIVWGRSLGWYFMGLVDTLEILSSTSATENYVAQLLGKFQSLAAAVIKAVDARTGAWWQVVDQQGREGNYIESSGSAMFTYALFKGARLGFLPSNETTSAQRLAEKAYEYLTETFVVYETDGTLGWNGTVSVCSLNSTATYEASGFFNRDRTY
ncbi:hypothetical protein N0V82_006372 [Gnomoniopsis sp. IMI 355080]|nr:hypothetical protein N0V82_006372 [Gnomoniopsis sp. IMI 355080]